MVRVLDLSISLLDEGLGPVLGHLESSLSFLDDNLCLIIAQHLLLIVVSLTFGNISGSDGLGSCLGQLLGVICFNQLLGLISLSSDLPLNLVSLLFDFYLKELDLLYVFVMLEGEQGLNVVSLELEQLLVLEVVDYHELVLLELDLLLEVHIVVGRVHKGDSEVSWQNDIHDVDLLNDDTIGVELGLKLLHHLSGQLSLDVSYSGDLDLFDEVTNFLITLLLEQLFESIRSKVVKEPFGVFTLGLL